MFVTTVLKRAWYLVTKNRSLWLLGILLAMVSGVSISTGLPNFWEDTRIVDLQTWRMSAVEREWVEENLGIILSSEFEVTIPEIIPPEVGSLLAAIAGFVIILAVAVFILFVVMLVLRYMAETSLIRTVDQIEDGGRNIGLWSALRLGWSRQAWRLFIIDVVVFLGVTLVLTMLVVPPAVFIPMMAGIGETALVFAIVSVVGYSVPVALATIFLITVAISFTRLCHRASTLEGLGVFPAIGRAFNMLGMHIKELGQLWLSMLAIEILYPFAVIPLFMVASIGSLLLSGAIIVPAMLTLMALNAAEWVFITAGVLSGLLFLGLLAVPLLFISGLKEAFTSSAWTVGYREVLALKPAEDESISTPEEVAFVGS